MSGTHLQDPSGKTIVLRGSALIDLGVLYWYGGQTANGITVRMDKVAAAGVQGHVVRLPVHPKIDYASNWSSSFQSQVALAVTKAPVFITEWGYADADPPAFGPALQSTAEGDRASWTAWVTNNAWKPSIFADANLTTLTNFGMLVKTWLGAQADSDWVQ